MIVRILGEGQYQVSDEALDGLNSLDADVESAVSGNDEGAFGTALAALLAAVREQGNAVEETSLEPSDLILPMADASLAEVRDLINGDGLIPG